MEFSNISGRFITDDKGVLIKHIYDDVTKTRDTVNEGYTEGIYENLIIPEGITGFADQFYRGCVIRNTLSLPNTLLSIGEADPGPIFINGASCVFADCSLPDVILPESLKVIGNFAFGSSSMKSLKIPRNLKSAYLRQFKESEVGILYLPSKYKCGDGDSLKSKDEQMHYIDFKTYYIHFNRVDEDFMRNFFVHCSINKLEWY